MDASLSFEWAPVGPVNLDHGGKLFFGPVAQGPGVYRFQLIEPGRTAAYVGEAKNLRRRLSHYRNPEPTQRTNIRLNDRLLSVIAAGGQAELAIITHASMAFDGVPGALDLHSKLHPRVSITSKSLRSRWRNAKRRA